MTKILTDFLVWKIGNSRGRANGGWDGKIGEIEEVGRMGYREDNFLLKMVEIPM